MVTCTVATLGFFHIRRAVFSWWRVWIWMALRIICLFCKRLALTLQGKLFSFLSDLIVASQKSLLFGAIRPLLQVHCQRGAEARLVYLFRLVGSGPTRSQKLALLGGYPLCLLKRLPVPTPLLL